MRCTCASSFLSSAAFVSATHVAEVDIRGVDHQPAIAGTLRRDPLEHRAVEHRAHFTLETGEREERRIVRQEK
jgi:hypothetical protein